MHLPAQYGEICPAWWRTADQAWVTSKPCKHELVERVLEKVKEEDVHVFRLVVRGGGTGGSASSIVHFRIFVRVGRSRALKIQV